jgi:plasmid stabilization system protein ParE
MQVIFSKRAKIRLENLLDYLEKEWSEKTKDDFIKKLDRSINQIKRLPTSCPESAKILGLFKCVVTKQTTLYYRIKDQTIQVITLFDVRQNPNKLFKEL